MGRLPATGRLHILRPFVAVLVTASCAAAPASSAAARPLAPGSSTTVVVPRRGLQISIGAPIGLQPAHPAFSYRISCSASCRGDVSLRAWLVGSGGTLTRIPKLDLAADSVSIGARSGGSQRFTHRYRHGALRQLERILQAGARVELRLNARVRSVSGEIVQAHSNATLQG